MFDEMLDESGGEPRPAYAEFRRWIDQENSEHLKSKAEQAEKFFRRVGITFNVYGESDSDERLIPFDIIPRILSASEWRRLARGIEQRVRAINALLYDLYHRQEILRAGKLPQELVVRNSAFLPQMAGVVPPAGG